MNIIVNKEDIKLRPINYLDTELIVKWRNEKFVQDNFIFRQKFTHEMHNNWMKTKVSKGKVVQYIICKANESPIGSVYYRDIDKECKSAEFGIFIGEKEAIGHGFGFKAASLFIDYGFTSLGLDRIILRVLKENGRAIHIYKKIGFTEIFEVEEELKPTGEQVDVIFMEIKRNIWLKKKINH